MIFSSSFQMSNFFPVILPSIYSKYYEKSKVIKNFLETSFSRTDLKKNKFFKKYFSNKFQNLVFISIF
jgi:hypothetical protein